MVKTIGPATGSKGQIGFKEESKWGYPASPPNKFVEFTSEGVISEFTSLVSNALRADRAVHKQRLGSEAAAGDINFELCPEGFGTLIKHALGKKRTVRKDMAFVVVYSGTNDDTYLSLSETSFSATDGDGTVDEFDITLTTGMTLQALITAINSEANFSCYAPWGDGTDGYFASSTKSSASSTLGDADYDSSLVIKTASDFKLETFSNEFIKSDGVSGNHLVFFVVNLKYGIYEHTLDANADLPQGLTFEIGRDVAAFNYYGGRVNSLAMTLNPGEIVTGTANLMFKGSSTCGDIVADSGNTGWQIPVVGIRYAGSEDSAKLEIDTDGSNETFYFEHGSSGSEVPTYGFTLDRPTCDHDGYWWDVTTIAGLLEFLEKEEDYFSITRKGGIPTNVASTSLADQALTALSSSSDTTLSTVVDSTVAPLVRGDYIGTDGGESVTITVAISTTGAMDGTAKFYAKKTGDASYGTPVAITPGTWQNINDGSDVDTGFDIMFPDSVTLTNAEVWTFTSFKDEASNATYESEELFTGFQGAVTLDKGDGSGAVSQGVMGASITLNNNLYGDKRELGDRQRAALPPQRRTTEGSLSLEFDDLDLYRMFVNGIAGDLTITLTSDDYINNSTTKYSFQLRLPNIKFSGTTPVIGDESIINTDFPFTALYDDDNSIPDLRIIITNGKSYI